jgi:hypothetical protein
MDARSVACWNRAAAIDKSLTVEKRLLDRLAKRELCATRYSRTRLFRAMAQQQTIVFDNFPLRGPLSAFFRNGKGPAKRLKAAFENSLTASAKVGPAQRVRNLKVHEIIDLWDQGNEMIMANDVYFRQSGLDRAFDFEALSDFNVLHTGPERIRDLEIATVLMGTDGCMTDSHSDDPDGCNHCVFGKKLWLAWDRIEGQRCGLEDCEYDTVRALAKFDLRTFLSLKSAHWFTVAEGQTLFMPGNLTHKVLTLDRYLGISAFYVSLPNALSSLTRWKLKGAIYFKARTWNDVVHLVKTQLEKTAAGGRDQKNRWGYYQLKAALQAWECSHTQTQKEKMRSLPQFNSLANRISQLCA